MITKRGSCVTLERARAIPGHSWRNDARRGVADDTVPSVPSPAQPSPPPRHATCHATCHATAACAPPRASFWPERSRDASQHRPRAPTFYVASPSTFGPYCTTVGDGSCALAGGLCGNVRVTSRELELVRMVSSRNTSAVLTRRKAARRGRRLMAGPSRMGNQPKAVAGFGATAAQFICQATSGTDPLATSRSDPGC